jgi:4-alpha-glucanotransferase
MMDRGQAIVSTPFPPGYRASGILLHITSLPSRYGIGDLGPSARGWIDLLVDAGQSWWQSLPFGPAGHGNSPYEPLCTFAGNELLISPEDLVEDGLLRSDDCAGSSSSTTAVDYPSVISFKPSFLGRKCARC